MAYSTLEGNFETEWDYLVYKHYPDELNTNEKPQTLDKKRFEDTNKKLDQEFLDQAQPTDANGNPVNDTEEPVQKLNSISGTEVAFNTKGMRRSDNIEDLRPQHQIWGTAFGASEGGPPPGIDADEYYEMINNKIQNEMLMKRREGLPKIDPGEFKKQLDRE